MKIPIEASMPGGILKRSEVPGGTLKRSEVPEGSLRNRKAPAREGRGKNQKRRGTQDTKKARTNFHCRIRPILVHPGNLHMTLHVVVSSLCWKTQKHRPTFSFRIPRYTVLLPQCFLAFTVFNTVLQQWRPLPAETARAGTRFCGERPASREIVWRHVQSLPLGSSSRLPLAGRSSARSLLCLEELLKRSGKFRKVLQRRLNHDITNARTSWYLQIPLFTAYNTRASSYKSTD